MMISDIINDNNDMIMINDMMMIMILMMKW